MFRTYDIRGKYGEDITPANFARLGAAFSRFSNSLVMGMDYRSHNRGLARAFCSGFEREIRFAGVLPTPAIAFSCEKFGICLTASHNPAEYNGAKPLKEKRPFFESDLAELKKAFESTPQKTPELKQLPEIDGSLVESYISALPAFSDRVIYDLGGGAVCSLKHLFPESIYNEPDPAYARHDPEPKESALGELKRATKQRGALGFAFDGDGDRVMAVDSGVVIDGGITLAFACLNHLPKNSRVMVTLDVSDEVFRFLEDSGFQASYSKVGDMFLIKHALGKHIDFAGERSGHYSFFKHQLYSDGPYCAALLSEHSPGELLEFSREFKNTTLIEQQFVTVDFKKLEQMLRDKAPDALETIDGVKARFDDYCILIRASNTEPKIRINVEAESREKALAGMSFAKKIVAASKV
ncbi:MAG: hypothetical protein V1834_04295 [Candidatus Micrarchaeota archaeon]